MKAALPLVVIALVSPSIAVARTPAIGEPAPPFSMTSFSGTKVSLDDLRGNVVVLNFWATWCAPCRKELPVLDTYFRIQEKYGLRVVAVTSEDRAPRAALKAVARLVSFPMGQIFRGSYGTVEALPTNFVIDRAGIVRYAQSGAFDLDALNAILVPLLREPAPVAVAPSAPPP